MTHRTIKIQFVGGPYDGHRQAFTAPPIVERLALPVNKNLLPLLKGKKPGPPGPTLTVARYELQKVEDGWQYRFVEAISAQGIDLEAFQMLARTADEDDTKKGNG